MDAVMDTQEIIAAKQHCSMIVKESVPLDKLLRDKNTIVKENNKELDRVKNESISNCAGAMELL